MRLMLEKKELTIEELRARLNRAVVSDEGANVSCDQVQSWVAGRYICHLPQLFHTENSNLGIFRRALEWEMLEYFMAVWYILRPFGILCVTLVYFPPFGYVVPRKIWHPWNSVLF
jgi:hypothetical protein